MKYKTAYEYMMEQFKGTKWKKIAVSDGVYEVLGINKNGRLEVRETTQGIEEILNPTELTILE